MNEQHVERGGPPTARNTAQSGNDMPKLELQDFEELLLAILNNLLYDHALSLRNSSPDFCPRTKQRG